jgi:asparagine synthase (glutamine-hydrolysing)
MCGIAGIISACTEAGSGLGPLSPMVASLDHRGPDDTGCARFTARSGQSIGIGSTRLAIIDVSQAGHQPMEGPTTHVVYNGEVYNFGNLREQLDQEGAPWKSQTDTETVLRAYERWGLDSFRRLRGMFALAIWDSQHDRLVLARDPLGIKPLYYSLDGSAFLFASEIRSLLASGLVARVLDPEGVASYLATGAVEAPSTIVKGIRSLRPGHYLTVACRDGNLAIEEINYSADLFQDSEVVPHPADRREAIDTLRSLLEESVRLHLVSDVPLAVFLSGGIDSSALVALMSRVSGARAKTFTVVFEEKSFSEQSYARLVAERFGSEHSEIMLSEQSCYEMLPAALAAMDQPTIDGLNTYVISRAVKDAGITVAMSGLGSDELFAGYPSFKRAVRFQNLDRIPHQVREAVAQAGKSVLGSSVSQKKAWQLLAQGGSPKSVYATSRQLFSSDEISLLMPAETPSPGWSSNGSYGSAHSSDRVNAISRFEIEGYMANMLLRDADQMSMACSLELRVPFVDAVVAPYVMNLPGAWKMDSGRPKPLLLDALGGLIPRDIWRRPKMGFQLPMERWMHSALRPDLEATFNNGGLAHLGISDSARAIWKTFDRTPRLERWSRPWSLHILKTWCEINRVGL